MSGQRPRVVCAMSGGVDSSVAAALLQRQGYEVLGAFMRLGSAHTPEAAAQPCDAGGDEGGSSGDGKHGGLDSSGDSGVGLGVGAGLDSGRRQKQGCCSVLDADDARRVAGMLGIPLYVLNFQEDFGRVIDYFVAEYNRGRTPNPCVRCNDWLKFGKLARYAQAVGAEFIASGHYARMGVDPATGQPALMRGRDLKKDQSYVLFGISEAAMRHTLLPIGDMEKSHVRRLAEELKLPVFNKPDSQEICFVPDGDYAGLVRRKTPEAFAAGEIVDGDGKLLGRHEGHQHFTVGQRRGVGVALGHPIYVVDIDPDANRVVVGEHESLMRDELTAEQCNILSARLRGAVEGIRCQAKIRYNSTPQPAIAWMRRANRRNENQSGENEFRDEELFVRFDEPQAAITPGQAVVLYDGDVVLGGGWIETTSSRPVSRAVLGASVGLR